MHQNFRIKFETKSEAEAREKNRAAEPKLAAAVDYLRGKFGDVRVTYLGPKRSRPTPPEEP